MKLSQLQIDFLLDHIEKDTVRRYRGEYEPHTRSSLMQLGLIREIKEGTITTPRGREIKCLTLARYAEALINAGYHLPGGQFITRQPAIGVSFQEIVRGE
jgi:hypothetical protein